MSVQTKHVSDRDLEQLIYGAEDSRESIEAFVHVESCAECRQKLEALTDEDGFSDLALSMLRVYPTVDDRFDVPQLSPARSAEGYLDYLSPPVHPELVGRLGRYDIERVIGYGGMGIVLKGFDSELNRPVAIKLLASHLAHIGTARQRFAREARAAAAVVHEHVVAIHNVETDGKIPFLVMQYVSGESLQARIDRAGPLNTKQVLRIGIQAAAGLAAAHEQGVIHRDIKPANILLENGVERVLLTDFGLARTVDDASLTHTGAVTGTPQYMSPEQANGEESDHRTDLFSLGSVLYFMATGRPPFRAEGAMGVLNRVCHAQQIPVWRINNEIPDELSDIIDRLLEKRPSRRFSNATEVKEALSRLLSKIQQYGIRRRAKWVRTVHRNGRTVSALLVICVAAIASSIMWPLRGSGPVVQSAVQADDGKTKDETRPIPEPVVSKSDFQTLFEIESSMNSSQNQLQSMNRQLENAESAIRNSRFMVHQRDPFWEEAKDISSKLDDLEKTLSAEQPHPSKSGVSQ